MYHWNIHHLYMEFKTPADLDPKKQEELYHACQSGDIALAKMALQNGAGLTEKAFYVTTRGWVNKTSEMLDWLLEQGCPIGNCNFLAQRPDAVKFAQKMIDREYPLEI